MGIVLTVLEPPHQPEPDLIDALPSGIGRLLDLDPRLTSPRFDMLLVTSRGLVVRDQRTQAFYGMPWANFSIDDHLRQHSRHAVLTLDFDRQQPVDLAIDRRLALNIASVAPILKLNPLVEIDDVVVADVPPVVNNGSHIDLDAPGAPAMATVKAVSMWDGSAPMTVEPPQRPSVPAPVNRFRIDPGPPTPWTPDPPPDPATMDRPLNNGYRTALDAVQTQPLNSHALQNVQARIRSHRRRQQALRIGGGLLILLVAGIGGVVASMLMTADDGAEVDAIEPTLVLTSEAVEVDW